MQNKIFYTFCFGFLGGVLLHSFVFIPLYLNFLFLVISLAVYLMYLNLPKNTFILFSFLILFSFSIGIFRFHIKDQDLNKREKVLFSSINKDIKIEGELVVSPEVKASNQSFILETHLQKQRLKILINTTNTDVYSYGEVLQVSGKLKKPDNFLTDQGKNFDYINYLRKDGIFYTMNYPEIVKTGVNNGFFLKKILFNFKNIFLTKLNNVISYPENALLSGIILGEKSGFDEKLKEDFIRTGTIHIVALSGYNVTIVAQWIIKLFSFLPAIFMVSNAENIGFGLGIFSIFLFVIMTGSSSTAIRAGIMAGIALVGRGLGRNYDVGRALILAAVLMVFINPLILVFDVSFELSFISTVAVIFLSPKLEKYFMFVTKRFGLRDVVSVTFSVYMFVLPFILYKMGNLSLVSLPVNFLILPFIPFTMFLGFSTGFVGIFNYTLSVPIGLLAQVFLSYEIKVIEFFSNLPFASFVIPDFPIVLVILFYIYFSRKIFFNS